jgi:hypothetical protein
MLPGDSAPELGAASTDRDALVVRSRRQALPLTTDPFAAA